MLVVTVAATWLVKVPLCAVFVLGLGLGVVGAWMGLAVEVAVLAVLAAIRIRGDAWLGR